MGAFGVSQIQPCLSDPRLKLIQGGKDFNWVTEPLWKDYPPFCAPGQPYLHQTHGLWVFSSKLTISFLSLAIVLPSPDGKAQLGYTKPIQGIQSYWEAFKFAWDASKSHLVLHMFKML